ncbi:MAG: prepilin-type N-terminal cleavage/methylation domain-containing protein [Candidatus Omnitrophica bacterium]|nr:prepilin-type N-terminal cleavage/methylation domain-containing protein [Candidatus Omnitrophota bacterium]
MTALRQRPEQSLTGFTLVELIVVITIISIVVAVTTSSYLAARVQGNEGAAKGALRSIQSACISYRSTTGAYPTSLAAMGSSYLGGGLESGQKSGYAFDLRNGNGGETFTCTAVPSAANFTGVRSYCTETSNVIYVYNAASITADGNVCPAGGTALSGG